MKLSASRNTLITPSNKIRAYSKLGMLLLIAVLTASCSSKISKLPKTLELDLPETWQNSTTNDTADAKKSTPKQSSKAEPLPAVEKSSSAIDAWLENFNDSELNSHVQTALRNNPNIIAQASELKAAIQQVTIAGASLWPQLQANLNDRVTVSDGQGASTQLSLTNLDLATELLSGNANTSVTRRIRTVSATIDISWEADLWGKLTQRKKAAALTAKAQAELYHFAELSLVANVSRAWFNLVTNKLQVDLEQQQLDSFKRTTSIIEENYQRGIRTAQDVYFSRSDEKIQVSSVANAKFNYLQALNAFQTLLGQYPNSGFEFNAHLPELNDAIPAGLPAQLLTRRPDIKASQLQYEAAVANAKAAYRDRFPTIAFSGSIGDSRDSFNDLFEGDNMIMSLVSGVTHPIFASGALYAQANQALYQAEQGYANLVRTALTAFEEVENSLANERLLLQRHLAVKQAVDLAEGGFELALDRYQSGLENYPAVLQAQRRLFDSMRNELNLRNAILQNRIGIHLALGGDFASEPKLSADANDNTQPAENGNNE